MKYLYVIALIGAFVLGCTIERALTRPAVAATPSMPSDGWTIHIDAEQHFGDAHPMEIAHHYCKGVTGGLLECEIFDSDAPDARLVAVETIVAPKVYSSFTPSEQGYWHYHKVEIPKVHATLPGMTPDQAAKLVAQISNTYGKIWLLWDPMTNVNPVGTPTITVLK
ncbi:MAG: DUF1264 domain-containing protein [Candidatus Eremiobacteraeota bacterium]|nr:DUF1264 domain-containing protein [Candidatus Eremiobacteraeota bacterium]